MRTHTHMHTHTHLHSLHISHALQMLLVGLTEFNVDEWEASTVYRNYTKKDKQIKWFWEVLRSWDNEKRARLLQFVTGSCRLPVGGFAHLMGGFF